MNFIVKIIIFYFSLQFFLYSTYASAYNYKDKLYLKGGTTWSHNKINALVGTEDEVISYGLISAYGYRWKNLEFYLSSNITFGKIENLYFRTNESDYIGSGHYKSVSITPQYKYISNYKINKVWHFYLTLGPTWAIQNLKFTNFTSSRPTGNDNFKLSYESFGGQIGIGVEEQIKFKEMHPVFLEFVFIKRSTYKVSFVDTSNTAEIKIVSVNDTKQKITEKAFIINMGITIF